ncbi:MAG: hypothetical protein NDJ89_16930 [Oligoflexia bacterium]|nr:hypothetical protein [Oligoflexia bacterium]
MIKFSQKRGFFGAFFVLLLGTLLLLAGSIANGPDRDLELSREVPSRTPVGALGERLGDLKSWPAWFHSLKEAVSLDPLPLHEGSRLKLRIEPPKKPWKRFELTARVIAFVPGQRLALRIEEDSTERLTRLFDRLEWRVEVLPGQAPFASLVRGVASAHTASWRARLLGTIAERIVLHQVYYPNLIQLAEQGETVRAE